MLENIINGFNLSLATANPEIFIFFAIFVIVIAVFAVSYFLEKKRTEKWREIAESMGFEFQDSVANLQTNYPFKLFTVGRSRKCKNVLSGGAEDTEMKIIDYQYTVGTGKNSTTYKHTTCILTNLNFDLPDSVLTKKSFFDLFSKKNYGEKINFDEDMIFGKKFIAYGYDENRIKEVYNQQIKDLCLEYYKRGINIETSNNQIMVYFRKRIKPENLQDLLQVAFNLQNIWVGI